MHLLPSECVRLVSEGAGLTTQPFTTCMLNLFMIVPGSNCKSLQGATVLRRVSVNYSVHCS